MAERLADIYFELVDDRAAVGLRAYDGSAVEREREVATVDVRRPRALRYLATAPGELGLARAYVMGDIEIDGDVHAALRELEAHRRPGLNALDLLGHVKRWMLRPAPTPQEELPAPWRRGLRRHSRKRDEDAIAHHYDLSNRFYELMLGPSMVYSCAVFPAPEASLEEAQREKLDLICLKLDLKAGERLLDVGAGWGGLVRHAAAHYGVSALGVTLSREQAQFATRAIADEGLAGQAEVRQLDYRDLDSSKFDAVASVGAMEHFGKASLRSHFAAMAARLRPAGRMLNHAISRPTGRQGVRAGAFVDRYVFPDGELESIGTVVSAMHDGGLEVRHEENLREHYAMTLREWSANLEHAWEEAVAEVGERRARVWRLYLALSRIGFETNRIQIHQVLGVHTAASGDSGMPLRPSWEAARPARKRRFRKAAERDQDDAERSAEEAAPKARPKAPAKRA
ncbi:MAG TPA: class I SAM-dependent methyltransferase [Solirubrobacteraceae bacterium]|nr:class I SAM-dependent methyltransferase [Solirubrobacteraceae bacterium]